MTPFPAPNRLHVWWARRPLVASRAAVLASLLPADADRERFTHVLGIHGDPGGATADCHRGPDRRTVRTRTVRLHARVLSTCRATPTGSGLHAKRNALASTNPRRARPDCGRWQHPVRDDATRHRRHRERSESCCGADRAGDNRVASEARTCGAHTSSKARAGAGEAARASGLRGRIPPEPCATAAPDGYLWARTITCPYCDGLIPLSPNWRLGAGRHGCATRPSTCRAARVRPAAAAISRSSTA